VREHFPRLSVTKAMGLACRAAFHGEVPTLQFLRDSRAFTLQRIAREKCMCCA